MQRLFQYWQLQQKKKIEVTGLGNGSEIERIHRQSSLLGRKNQKANQKTGGVFAYSI